MASDSHNPPDARVHELLREQVASADKWHRNWRESEAEVARLREALLWICEVNAMDYEYRRVAREALGAGER